MNKRVLVILLSAFVVAAGCSYLIFRLVGTRIVSAQHRTATLLVASRDVQLGSLLTDGDLGTMDIGGTIPKGAILNRKDAVGRGVISNLFQGEPILESRLAAPGSGGGLASTIRQGMRACAVKVDDVVGVAGFVTAGTRVDVLMSGNPPGAQTAAEGTKVKTLLQNIEVLSAGTDIQKDAEGKPKQVQVVNLLVTPDQAERLSLAGNQAHIQLVLRNPLDTQIAEPPGTAMASLFADKTGPVLPASPTHPHRQAGTPVAARPASRVYLVQVFNGIKRSEEKFETKSEEKQ